MPQAKSSIDELRRLLKERAEAQSKPAAAGEVVDPFADGDDRFAMPYGYVKPQPEKDLLEPRNADELSGQNKFISEPDLESLRDVAETTKNPELLHHVWEETCQKAAEEFLKRNPSYERTDDNFLALLTYMVEANIGHGSPVDEETAQTRMYELAERKLFTVAELERAFQALKSIGEIELVPGFARELTEAQKLRVTRMAQLEADVSRAVGYYLAFATGVVDPDEVSEKEAALAVRDVLNDPRYLSVVNEAVLFAWSARTHGYRPTPGRVQFLVDFAAGRPFSLGLLDAAWEECKQFEKEQGRRLEQQRTETPTQEGIDALDDQALANLYSSALSERGRRIRDARQVTYQSPEQWLQQQHMDSE